MRDPAVSGGWRCAPTRPPARRSVPLKRRCVVARTVRAPRARRAAGSPGRRLARGPAPRLSGHPFCYSSVSAGRLGGPRARADSRSSPRRPPGQRAAPALARSRAGDCELRRSASRARAAPCPDAWGSPGAGRGPAGTCRLVPLGESLPRVPAHRPGPPPCSSQRRPGRRAWPSPGARLCPGALAPVSPPAALPSRLAH